MQGKFITIEGPDGSGKSTQASILYAMLVKLNYDVLLTREPGGSPVGEQLRSIILSDSMHSKTELLLFAAARNEHIETIIKPALASGKIVISDRFSDSSYAYQGGGRGLLEGVLHLQEFVHDGFEPDHTLFFAIEKEESLRRLTSRFATQKGDRFELEVKEFKSKVHDAYNEAFHKYIHRMHRIDANGSIEEVTEQLKQWVDRFHLNNSELCKDNYVID